MLDTDIASYIIKGRSPRVADQLARVSPSDICVSAVTRGELVYGLKQLEPGHRLHLGVRQFLRIVRVLAWDSDAADHYADIRHRLVSSGRTIGELDMMIAAHSLAAGAVLVTNNVRHYERIGGSLALANWAST